MSNSAKNGKNSAGDGCYVGSNAVSSQIHIVHNYESLREPWNSLMKTAGLLLQKQPDLPPPQLP